MSWVLHPLELEAVTILCGGNGSGKTTILNLMGERLGLRRGTVLNRSSYFSTTSFITRSRTYREPVCRWASTTWRSLSTGNGSGKTTILNLMGERLGLRRGTVFNRSSFFGDYLYEKDSARQRRKVQAHWPEGRQHGCYHADYFQPWSWRRLPSCAGATAAARPPF